MKPFSVAVVCAAMSLTAHAARADGLISKIASAPILANGLLTDMRSGTNIFLQSESAPGDAFLDPAVIGYGIEPGGYMEIEMVAGFDRDPKVALDTGSILLVAGTPQQAITAQNAGYRVEEGENPFTFRIVPTNPDGMPAERLLAALPPGNPEPIAQHGIKIIHIGRSFAFINRGDIGTIAVRLFDGNGKLKAEGSADVRFLREPTPQIFPTNIPDKRRNRNWQRVGKQKIVGAVSEGTLPLSFLLFDRNEGFGNAGIVDAGVISAIHLRNIGFQLPQELARYNGGLILQDVDESGDLDPFKDRIIGGVIERVPDGATGHYAATPTVEERPWLSRPTGTYDKNAEGVGGAIMDIVYITGDQPGKYEVTLALLKDSAKPADGDGSSYTYTVVVQ